MDWMLPGVARTGKRVECCDRCRRHLPRGEALNEHIYWDQASVLVQRGLLDPSKLPVAGVETARKLGDPSLPSNRLMERVGSTRRSCARRRFITRPRRSPAHLVATRPASLLSMHRVPWRSGT